MSLEQELGKPIIISTRNRLEDGYEIMQKVRDLRAEGRTITAVWSSENKAVIFSVPEEEITQDLDKPPTIF